VDQCQVSGLAIRVNAGLVLSALAVCVSWMFSLSLLATARGGASSWSLATKKRSKENAFNHATLGVHSVQFSFIGAPKARCSPESRMCEPLLLANPDMNTLRPVRSRASTSAREPRRPHALLRLRFLVGWLSGLCCRAAWPASQSQSDAYLLLQFLVGRMVGCLLGYFVEYGLTHFCGLVSQVGWRRGSSCVQIWGLVVRG
jgi:hypothetical protein